MAEVSLILEGRSQVAVVTGARLVMRETGATIFEAAQLTFFRDLVRPKIHIEVSTSAVGAV